LQLHSHCISACDGIANFEFDSDLHEAFASSSSAFPKFGQDRGDDVFEAAFGFQIQPLRPDLAAVILYAERSESRAREIDLLRSLKLTLSRIHMTIRAFLCIP
jgi:DnaJ-class molecular chaperone